MRAAGRPDRAGEGAEQLVLALSLERDDAGDLAVAEVERDVVELGADAQVADAEARRACRRPAGVAAAGERAARACSIRGAEHQLDDLLLGAGRHVDDADGLAVAQHGGAVAQRGDLDEAVRDEDDRAAGLALAADDVEHPLGEVRRQRRGHLVEQQHVGLDGQRAREVEDAQHGERDVARGVAEVEVGNAELADPVEERLDRRAGEAKVGGDVEIGDQRRLLVDRHQAGAARLGGRVDVARLAADQDAAGVRRGSRRSGS